MDGMRRRIGLAAATIALSAACIPDRLCDTVEKDNACSSDSDCVVAYCSVECGLCEKVYSRKQVDRGYCLVGAGESVPDRCRSGYEDLNCSPTPIPCPPTGTPRCEGGKCVPVLE